MDVESEEFTSTLMSGGTKVFTPKSIYVSNLFLWLLYGYFNKQIFVNDEVITDKEKLTIVFDPVSRIGKSYAFLGDEIEAPVIP